MSRTFQAALVGVTASCFALASAVLPIATAQAAVAPPPPANAGTSSGSSDHQTFVDSGAPSTSFYDGANNPSGLVPVGFLPASAATDGIDHRYRDFFHLQLPALKGAVVTSAQLILNESSTSTCTPSGLELWSSAAFTSRSTWQRQPSLVKRLATATTTPDAADCPAPGGYAPVTFDVTGAIGQAVQAGTANWTVSVKAPAAAENDNSSSLILQSAAFLQVDYVYPPLAPIDLAPTAQSGQAYDGPVTNFVAAAANPGDSLFTEEFDVWTATGGKPVAQYTGGSSSIGAGDSPLYWQNSTPLADGNYVWRARTVLQTGYPGPWTAWNPITVDSIVPPAPTLTSNPPGGDPNSQGGAIVGQPITITVSDPGSEAYAYYLGAADGYPVLRVGEDPCAEASYGFLCPKTDGGAVSTTISAKDGFNRYTAYAYSRAGYVSAASQELDFFPQPDAAALAAAHIWDTASGNANPIADSAPTRPRPLTVSPKLVLGTEDVYGDGSTLLSAITFDGKKTYASTTAPVIDSTRSFTFGATVQVPSGIGHSQVVFAQAAASGTGDAVSLSVGTDGLWHFCLKQASANRPACATTQAQFDTPQSIYAIYDQVAGAVNVVAGYSRGDGAALTGKAAASTGSSYLGRGASTGVSNRLNGLLYKPFAAPGVLTYGQIYSIEQLSTGPPPS